MSKFKPVETKEADDGSKVTLLQDHSAAWFVGRKDDPQLEPIPLGAFTTEAGARHWADEHFPGGNWQASS